jgi:hypothetical protein
MAKWKFFKPSKGNIHTEPTKIPDHVQESEEHSLISETTDDSQAIPVKEYNEILYSKGSEHKKQPVAPEQKPIMRRTSWETPDAIEHSVDMMGRRRQGIDTEPTHDVEQKVDRILLKKKNRL